MIAERNPVIKEAYCKLQVMSNDEANRMIYEARLKAQRDEYSRIQGAIQEGQKKGQTEGRKEGRKEIIVQMAEHGMTAKTIASITLLSEGEVSGILGEKPK
jgi:predicted transposase/invertase (TIGR01784 family)